MKGLFGTLLLAAVNSFAGIQSEGFVKLIGHQYWLQNAHDSSAVLPKVAACHAPTLKPFQDLNVRLEWEQKKSSKCFDAIRINAIAFDPLKGSFKSIRTDATKAKHK